MEAETALEGWARLRLFDHLGFRRVDVPYVQPPLAPDKQPIDYMDLLFAPWQAQAAANARIPSGWVVDTLEAIWSAWTPATAAEHLARLRHDIVSGDVALHTVQRPSP
jgi:hypothetical protein